MKEDLKQLIESMKVAAEKAQRTPMWRMDSRVSLEFERHVKPDSVLALIAEVERLQQENERLKREINDAAEDLKDAATEARWQSMQGEDYGSY